MSDLFVGRLEGKDPDIRRDQKIVVDPQTLRAAKAWRKPFLIKYLHALKAHDHPVGKMPRWAEWDKQSAMKIKVGWAFGMSDSSRFGTQRRACLTDASRKPRSNQECPSFPSNALIVLPAMLTRSNRSKCQPLVMKRRRRILRPLWLRYWER